MAHEIKVYDTVVFKSFPDIGQKMWPAHCIQNSDGAKLHSNLILVDESDKMKRKFIYTNKGQKPDIDSYSGFFDNCKLNKTDLDKNLKSYEITDLYVCGLAADVCVGNWSFCGFENIVRLADRKLSV